MNDLNEIDDLKKEIGVLRDFQKSWKWIFRITCATATVFSIFFGWKIYDLNQSLKNASDTQKLLEDRLTLSTRSLGTLRQKAQDAETLANNASKIAGDLVIAINEAKNASHKAEQKSSEVEEISKNISQKFEETKQISTEAKATAGVVESRFRQVEILLAEFKNPDKNNNGQQNKKLNPSDLKQITIKLNGDMMCIRFIEGPNPFNDISIDQNYYHGNVFVPEGYCAKIVGSVTNSGFIVSKELIGRVVDSSSGYSNSWSQETENEQFKFIR